MAARVLSLVARARILRVHRLVPLSLLVVVLLGAFPSVGRCLAVSDTGRWTPTHTISGIPVHMALSRGHGPYHSQILWYYGLGHHEATFGGLLGWKPGEYNCTGYPDTTILAPITLPIPHPDQIFCSGHSGLADGRLFVPGGTQAGTEFGVRHAYIFDPVGITWTKVDSMAHPRWYPTSTSLANGQQLVTSGSQDIFLNFHFGRINPETVPTDSAVFRYGPGGNGNAYSPVRTSSSPLWPRPREGQALAITGRETYLFGGKDRSGAYMLDTLAADTRIERARRGSRLQVGPAPERHSTQAALGPVRGRCGQRFLLLDCVRGDRQERGGHYARRRVERRLAAAA